VYTKEVGVRKALGSKRMSLVRKFAFESFLTTIIAFLLALIMVSAILPWFCNISGKTLNIPWTNVYFWLLCVLFIIITNLLSGAYPAIYLSSFQPLKALSGSVKQSRWGINTREFFVVFQFTISIALIIASLVIFKQVVYSKNRPVGYSPKGLIVLNMNTPDYRGKYSILKDELKNTGAVEEITAANYPITDTKGWNSNYTWTGKDENLRGSFNVVYVTPTYAKTMNLKFVEGRDFLPDSRSDMSSAIINESAQRLMGLNSPIGEVVIRPELSPVTIIGVVSDMVKGSPYEPTDPVFIFPSEGDLNWLYIRINPNLSVSNALSKIQPIINKIVPLSPFDFSFVDVQFNDKFKEEVQFGNLVLLFTILAILISCLGLFGFAAFIAESRTKEIGIRRVNGAKVFEILVLLTNNFTARVLIACIIACPVSWYSMNFWLEGFSYRTTMSWWIFFLACIGTLFIALITVSWQSWRAATRNPVEALSYE
jgi:putative ABC transport system permease protein